MSRDIDPELLQQWRQKSEEKLRAKMKENITLRAPILQTAVNTGIQQTMNETQSYSKCNWKFISCIKPFIVPQTLIDSAIEALFAEIDRWKGVEIAALHEPPSDWNGYYKTADNWWNRYKSKWLGDLFFYPLFSKIFMQYIDNMSEQHYISNGNNTKQMNDLLYFNVILKILHSQITFNRTRAQPLMLDRSFGASKKLKNFFIDLGKKHHIEWDIRSNTGNNRLEIRGSVQKWVIRVLDKKKAIFNGKIPALEPIEQKTEDQPQMQTRRRKQTTNGMKTSQPKATPPKSYQAFVENTHEQKLEGEGIITTIYNGNNYPSVGITSAVSSNYNNNHVPIIRNHNSNVSHNRDMTQHDVQNGGYNGYHSSYNQCNTCSCSQSSISCLPVQSHRYHPFTTPRIQPQQPQYQQPHCHQLQYQQQTQYSGNQCIYRPQTASIPIQTHNNQLSQIYINSSPTISSTQSVSSSSSHTNYANQDRIFTYNQYDESSPYLMSGTNTYNAYLYEDPTFGVTDNFLFNDIDTQTVHNVI